MFHGMTIIGAIMLAIGIGIQNFPEGAAVALPLRREGYSRFKSFMIGQASALVEPISAVIGAILVIYIRSIMPFLLAFAAGAMIIVAARELFEALKIKKIYVRYFNKPRIDNYLRVTIGTDEEMDAFVTFLRKYLSERE